MLNLPATTSQDDYIPLDGGLDLITPTLKLKAGVCREAQNFEAGVTGGYTRIAGYERADGRPAPSDADYIPITLNVTGALAVGNTITGATSGATGKVIYRNGALVVFTRGFGVFQLGETVTVSGTTRATVSDLGGAEDRPDFDVSMRALAADDYRADILPVPGSGPVRGVFYFKGVLYALRNNAGATACVLHKATASGWAVVATPALLPGGNYEFDIGTVAASQKVYGVDGVNKAFEFDGTTLLQVTTGTVPDNPRRVMVHSGHLFLAYGPSVQHSGIGDPFDWTPAGGAGELLADGDVQIMRPLPGSQASGAAAIGHESGMQILYGKSQADFQLVGFEDSSGAKARSAQRLGEMFVLDDRGALSLSTSQNFGNFAANTITLGIRPYIQARRNLVTGSAVNREKNQYRLFFSDGSALYMTITNGRMRGAMPIQFAHVARCVCQGETPDGAETCFFGSDDGFVYRLDAGTSFDGAPINFYLTLVPANQGTPRQNKRYRKATVEVQGDAYASFNMAFDFAYSSTERAQQDAYTTTSIAMAAARWDEFTWDTFTWDGNSLAPSEIPTEGTGENIATSISGESALFPPFSINSLIITYSLRRRLR